MKKVIVSVLILLLALCLVCGLLLLNAAKKAKQLPENNPAWFLANKDSLPPGKTVVCVGDSITHGRVSADYVRMVGEQLGAGYRMVNAGINGQLAWNILQRIEEIIACEPDYITILIGSNDAKGSLRAEDGEKSLKEQGLPQMPDDDWYRENLNLICDLLSEKSGAQIALLSIPPLGERLDHEAFRHAAGYSLFIRETCDRYGFSYLPLNERMVKYLEEKGSMPELSWDDGFMDLTAKAVVSHYLLGRSYNKITEENGLLLMPDQLHLNETSAGMAAELIAEFVE